MRWSTAAGVGVVVVVAVAILVAAFVLLESAGVIGNTYPLVVEFNNAQGVTKGAEVRLAGVKIGEVEAIGLTPGNRAQLKLRISQRYTVPSDAQIRLSSSGLFSPPMVEIIPRRQGPPEKGARRGTSTPTLDELLPEAQRLLANLSGLTKSMQDLVGDQGLRRELKRATTNIADVAERGKVIAAHLEAASETGQQIATRFKGTTQRLDRTAALLQQTMAENRGKIGETLTSVNDTMAALQGLVEQLTTVVADPKVKGSLRGTLANVEQTTAHLAKLSANLEQLSGDAKLNEDLRATVTGTRGAVEETQRLMQRLNRVLGGGRKRVEGAREKVENTDLTVDVAQQTSPARPRIDLNAFIPSGGGRFYRLGLYDVSEGNKLNLQLGQPLGKDSLRYGLYASRLGVGLDFGPPTHPRFSADLYGLDNPQLDLRGRTQLSPGLDLTFGMQKVFRSNAPTLGVTWRK